MIETLPPAAGSPIKSIQNVSITIATSASSNTATISSVDTNKAVVYFHGQENGDATDIRQGMARLDLTNATTVTATRAGSSSSRTLTVKAQVVEFN